MSVCPTTFAVDPSVFPGIRLRRLSKRYGKDLVIQDLSLDIPAGETFGLLGPNGAGKTTILRMIAGLTRPQTGSIEVFGLSPTCRNPRLNQLLGVVPQENNLENDLTVEEALLVYGRLYKLPALRQTVQEHIQLFHLEAFCHRRISLLSGGMARKALIARAMLPKPKVLLLDEPTVGLDPDVRQDIWEGISQLSAQGTTVIFTTHYMEEADALCHRVGLLKSGRMVLLETPAEIRRRFSGQGSSALQAAFLQFSRQEEL